MTNETRYRPHQLYTITKTIQWIKEYENNEVSLQVLWGHMARSGKTYMMKGLIEHLNFSYGDDDDSSEEESFEEDTTYLIITTAPKETLSQCLRVMKPLEDLGIKVITSKKDLNSLSGKNVVILSKQLLTNRANRNIVIANVKVIIFDEAHNGGTTALSKSMLDKYDCPKIFSTATYNKVLESYDIHEMITWDLQDSQLLKSKKIDELENKYPGFANSISSYNFQCEGQASDENICEITPTLNIIGINKLGPDVQSWYPARLFKVKESEFENTQAVNAVFTYVLHDILDNIEARNSSLNQRLILNSDEPSVIMCFLPPRNISVISNLVKSIIETIDHNHDFEVCLCNTIDSRCDIKTTISRSMDNAKIQRKKSVIALAGTQGHLGATFKNCDLVLLMSTTKSNEKIYQSMFRCMTERADKKNGYVIDVDIKRSINIIRNYGETIFVGPTTSHELIRNIISIGAIHWTSSINFELNDTNQMISNILEYCD